jgi:hypothetical protein
VISWAWPVSLVEGGEPFGVLGDLQHESGDDVGRVVGVLIHCHG